MTNRLDREYIQRTWGWEEIITNTDNYCMKLLHIEPGKRGSLHYHFDKDETFLVLKGEIMLEHYFLVGDAQKQEHKQLQVLRGVGRDSFHLAPRTPHRFWSNNGAPAIVLECSTKHSDDDVVRLELGGDLPV